MRLDTRTAQRVANARLPDQLRAQLDHQRAGRSWLLLGPDWAERRAQAIRDARTAAGFTTPTFRAERASDLEVTP